MRSSGGVPAFENWAGNQRCRPAARLVPRSAEEIAAAVARAAADGRRVKVVGAGHSFTDIACTDGTLLSLDRLADIEAFDLETGRVTVGAGIRLHQLSAVLADVGLAMANLGDVDVQSLAGAISTGTHGTGLGLGGLATQVVGLELVDGTGRVVRCDPGTEPELFACARVGLGALGVLTAVTLQCVPAFRLHARETTEPLEELLDGFVEVAAAHDHLELFWVPGSGRATVKRNDRTERPVAAPGRVAYVRDKLLTENLAFGLACRAARRWPSTAPTVARLVAAGGLDREFVDRSDRVFASPRHVRFLEMEYAVPVGELPAVLREIRALCDRLAQPVTFPIEVRTSAADDIPLSPASGRASGYVAVHAYPGTPHDAYFAGVERIVDAVGGRPHWGKLHHQHAGTLRPRYPGWDRFAAVRAVTDPTGVFANPYLDRVLGPPGAT